jgi:oligopeptide/dipeptide ABC transporter ATP-binding protein
MTLQRPSAAPLLGVDDLIVHFPLGGGLLRKPRAWVKAVDGVSFEIHMGQTLGLVGESGSGKTTVGRAIMRLNEPIGGSILLDGEDILSLRGEALRRRRRKMQMVFQDPQSSLDPRQTVARVLAEPLSVHRLGSRASRRDRVAELLELVGLSAAFMGRYPHELSGGQLQRVAIARALAVEPAFIVCDEPVSALDVSIQAQVMNLLRRLQGTLGLTYLFIAHDLAVVRHIAQDVAVMYLGKVVELGPASDILSRPGHPYTIALLSAVPVPDAAVERRRRRLILTGDVPSPVDPPKGCRFSPRCWLRARLGNPARCAIEEPRLISVEGGHAGQAVACHYSAEITESDRQFQQLSGVADRAAATGDRST